MKNPGRGNAAGFFYVGRAFARSGKDGAQRFTGYEAMHSVKFAPMGESREGEERRPKGQCICIGLSFALSSEDRRIMEWASTWNLKAA